MIELKFNKGISLNQWYAGMHWTKRQKMKNDWRLLCRSMLKTKEKFDQYGVELEYNSRLDPDNCVPVIKLTIDSLRHYGHIVNDTKKYCKKILIKPNLELPLNTYILRVYEYKQESG